MELYGRVLDSTEHLKPYSYTMDAAKKIEEIMELGRGYALIKEMRDLSIRAENDDEVLKLLMEMAMPCLSMNYWKQNGIFCSSLLSAIAQTKKTKSMSFMIKFIHKLPENTSLGIVDLISGLIPGYGKMVTASVKEMSTDGENSVIQAIGIQALCKMVLERTLEMDDEDYLMKIISGFSDDVYLTSHIVDLARSSIASRRKLQESLDDFMDDLLIEF